MNTTEKFETSGVTSKTEQPEITKSARKKKKNRALDQLETYHLILANVPGQPEIAQQMAEMGYTAEVLAKGKALYDESIEAFKIHSLKKSYVLSANKKFRDKWEVLKDLFTIHLEKARVVFRRDEAALLALSLKGTLPNSYLALKAKMVDFYTKVTNEEGIMQEMARLGFTEEDLNEGLSLINEVEGMRATFMKKKAEAQDATEKRNEIFREAEIWMQDFFAVAKIAVRKSPQLQEAFGKIIRN